MPSLKPAFDNAKAPSYGLSLFWLMVWAVAIDNDRQRRETERRRKAMREKQWQLPLKLKRCQPILRPRCGSC